MEKEIFQRLREKKPLIHCISNRVTLSEVANVILAVGASPIMAMGKEEVEEITSMSQALYLNLGTLNEAGKEAMRKSITLANQKKIPVILDPVGVGASSYRARFAQELIQNFSIQVIRGNISEIEALTMGSRNQRGVDAKEDAMKEENISSTIKMAQALAQNLGTLVAITGAMDIVSDGNKTFLLSNGHVMMKKITGTGCQASAMIASFVAANPKEILKATMTALCGYGICGERAFKQLDSDQGLGSYRIYLHDQVDHLNWERWKKEAKYFEKKDM